MLNIRRRLVGTALKIEYALVAPQDSKMLNILKAKGKCANAKFMTKEEAAACTTFKEANKTIFENCTYPFFLNLRWFVNYKETTYNVIAGLYKICLPKTTLSRAPINGLGSNLKYVIIPEGCKITVDYLLNYKGSGTKPTFDLIVEDSNPDNVLSKTITLIWNCTINNVYVPDSSVNLYKSSSRWSNIADSKFKPMSQFVEV